MDFQYFYKLFIPKSVTVDDFLKTRTFIYVDSP